MAELNELLDRPSPELVRAPLALFTALMARLNRVRLGPEEPINGLVVPPKSRVSWMAELKELDDDRPSPGVVRAPNARLFSIVGAASFLMRRGSPEPKSRLLWIAWSNDAARPLVLRKVSARFSVSAGDGYRSARGAARLAVRRVERAMGRTEEIFMVMVFNGCGDKDLDT